MRLQYFEELIEAKDPAAPVEAGVVFLYSDLARLINSRSGRC